MLKAHRSPLAHADKIFIGGAWMEPSSSATIQVINPATADDFFQIAEAQAADVNRAVATARHAFDHGPWPRMRHAERAAILRLIAAEIEVRRDELARIHTGQMGVILPIAHALAGPRYWEFYADLAADFEWEGYGTPESGGALALVVREPVGVVGAIIPWNVPMGLITMKCAPALLAGCTVVLKASPEAPGEAYIMAEIIEKIGLPPGVFNVLVADRPVSELLVRHPDVDKITFTGSTAAGRKIGGICGERIARQTLELGGKSPAVILDDYDAEMAAQSIAASAIAMTGQVCSSLTRIIVPDASHDRLVDALSARFSTVRIGDPLDAATGMGPLAMSRQRDRVESYIARGKDDGATLACGGSRPRHLNHGYYIEPTVFGNVDNASAIAQEEIFGPVLSVIRAQSEAQAIEIANDTAFGLGAAVFTNDPDRAYAAARKIRAGGIGHNAFRGDFSLPFGGFKKSGIGREGGAAGLAAFLETKTIILDSPPSHLARAGTQ